MRLTYSREAYSIAIRVELNPDSEARLIGEAHAKGRPLEKVSEGRQARESSTPNYSGKSQRIM